MKYKKIAIFLLILISLNIVFEFINEGALSKITTNAISKVQTKATAILTTLTINVDDGAPKIYIDSPKSGKIYNKNNIQLNFTVVDSNLNKVYYNIDNGNNITITENTTFSISSETPSVHTLKLFANDTLGQINSTFLSFWINLSKGHDIDFNNFNEGHTTNFSFYNITQLQNLSNVKIEKLNFGIIEFLEGINISSDLNLTKYINFSFNRIELNSALLSELNKSAALKIYNLTLTNPRLAKDGNICPDSICKKNSYSNGILSFNVTGFSVYSAEESSSSSSSGSSGGSGGGGGGGGSGSSSSIIDFSINKDLIKLSLLQGETKIELIEIENIGKSNLDLSIELKDIEDFLIFPGGVSKYSLNLQPGEKQAIQLIFNAASKYKAGIYPGKIIIKSTSIQKIITTIIGVESSKKIFDVDLKIQKKQVLKGDNLNLEVVLFNLGKEYGRVDTQVEVGIKDLEGNIINKAENRVAVETQASFVQNLLVPKELKEGRYVAYVIAKFGEETGIASEVFEVVSRPAGFFSFLAFYKYIIPGFILIIIIIVVLLEIKHHSKKVKERNFIPNVLKNKNEKFDINKFLREIDEGGYIDHKRTIESKLRILKQDYELGLIDENKYLELKSKLDRILKKN